MVTRRVGQPPDLGNPQTLNLYDYVGGDPTNHPDADGHLQGPGQEASNACADNQQCAENKQGQAHDQTVQAQKKTTEIVVTAENSPTHQLGTFAGREATYYVVEVDKEGKRTSGGAETNHDITLSEKSSNLPKGNQIADPPQTKHRLFEDTQSVKAGHPYDVTRRWSVDKHPARVLDPVSGKLYNYEILHLSFEARPQLRIEYKNDQ